MGIVGGIAPESTVEYYRLVVAAYRARVTDGSYPPLVINSIDTNTMRRLMEAGRRGRPAEYLLGELQRLADAGSDFALLAPNRSHVIFDELRRVGLLGTRFTMQGGVYRRVFARGGVEVVTPEAADQAYVHEKYMGEFIEGVFLDETREGLLAVVDRLRERGGVEGVVLGGTELPLILRDPAGRGIHFLDTTRIHAERAAAEMFA